jgi:phosphoglycolate phosphatase-like HAD superfamily hydrolase
MNRIRAIIYDCDGVLFESRRANLAYYNAILSHFDEPHVEESDQARSHLCHTAASPNVFSQLLGVERTPLALAFASELDYRQFIPLMSPEPGMQDALAKLSVSYPLAVATNRGYSMPSILEHFGLSCYFNTVVTSRDVERPKPVGDSELDQAAAQEAGMPFANYRGELKADVQLGHHNDLVQLFLYGEEAKVQPEHSLSP